MNFFVIILNFYVLFNWSHNHKKIGKNDKKKERMVAIIIFSKSFYCGFLQAFPGHRGPVSCLTFRQGTSELFSGSYDRTVKIWNVEDRAYINTLFGHQSDVLTIDCLRKERLLTVGRDRSMQLWKVDLSFVAFSF